MKEYKPPFALTHEIVSYVSSISEKLGRIGERQEFCVTS